MSEPRIRPRHTHLDAQEEMVTALWEFAQAVERTIREGETWEPAANGIGATMTDAKHRCLGEAMERISAGYGFHLVSIQ